ncbi:MAG: DUF1573 domain-containing protein [Putridiphycobacter sp.]
MKKIILGLTLLASLGACTSNQGENAEERKLNFAQFIDEPTTIEFEEMGYDFGTVTDGDLVNKTFKFTNTGDKELVLISVKGSCGCTVPDEWPKQPIAPGQTGEIKVTFNSANRVGNVQKSVRVEANTEPTVTTLTITGKVLEK